MNVIHIVAMTKNGIIGKGNKLPFKIKQDLERFKLLTDGKLIVMGYKTFKSILENYSKDETKFLENRNVIVSVEIAENKPTYNSLNKKYSHIPNVNFINHNMTSFAIRESYSPVVIVGGESLYSKHQPSVILATIVDMEVEEVNFKPVDEKSTEEVVQPALEDITYKYPFADMLEEDAKGIVQFKEKPQQTEDGLSYQFVTVVRG